ncbi:hypothetical protein ACILE9_11640 [Capnocytophaga cynodegmi]|uniref:hypothetical protein n=1 Tax=Capnocytophaga cynodegmi TaxID=28189 RepID=UPI0037D6A8BE
MRIKVFLAVLIAVCLTSLSLNWRQWLNKKKSDERIAELVELGGKAQIVTQYVRDSVPHTVFKEVFVRDNATEKRLAITKSYADSLEQALRISIDKMNQVSKINGKLTAQLKLQATQNEDKHYKDKWLSLTYDPRSDIVNLDYNVNLNLVRYSDKRWFGGIKKHYIDIFSDDPRVKIQGLQTFQIAEKPPAKMALALQGGYGVTLNNPLKVSPYIGVGLSYNLIHF